MADNFVDMALTEAEQKERNSPVMLPSGDGPRYPYGLCICLTHDELDKLGMDSDLRSGDVVEMDIRCKVTSVTETDRDGAESCRVELQITGIAVDGEGEDEEPPRRLGRRLPYRE